jgi:hypothetical protein
MAHFVRRDYRENKKVDMRGERSEHMMQGYYKDIVYFE